MYTPTQSCPPGSPHSTARAPDPMIFLQKTPAEDLRRSSPLSRTIHHPAGLPPPHRPPGPTGDAGEPEGLSSRVPADLPASSSLCRATSPTKSPGAIAGYIIL